mgnify:CR=1 FL=1
MAKDSQAEAFVRFNRVQKSYDGETLVVKDLNLEIPKGEFLTMLGPSGSGKTTCLMMLAGFETATHGDIMLNGVSINNIPPHKRGIGMVFQNYALFPHMTVAENLSFPLEVRKLEKSVREEKVARALDMVEMGGFKGRRPAQLSGGQQQRIALARALVFEPELVLMDEPLGALDKQLREKMQFEITALAHRLGITVVYVTHDQTEALTMSDRVAVFNDGRIQQLATPDQLYEEPENSFVAQFIGENNTLNGVVKEVNGSTCTVDLDNGHGTVKALKVNINGAYTLPSSDGSAGQVLQTDGSGAVTFGTVSVGDFTFTGSTIISPSNADITLDPSGSGEIALNANTTITGNLTVSGTQTTLETTTLVVEDPLLELAKNNSSGIANTMDQGLFFNRGSDSNVSFLWDESADEFAFAVTSGEDGTTQGNVTIDSYANIRANIVNTTGNVILGEDAVMVFEGASDNTNETTLTVVDPTADRTISLPNKSGTLATTEDTSFPESTTPTHPAASGNADLGSDLTTSITDAFSVPTADLYDHMEPRGSTTSVDLGSVA